MSAIGSVPLLAIVVAIYNLLALTSPEIIHDPFFTFDLLSGAAWTITVADVLLGLGLVLLYGEIIKSTRTSSGSTLDHLLSMLVLIVCLLEFVSLRPFGTSTFFLLLMMTFVDVVAGFTVGIKTARRDIDISR